jgi:hypothetical protein
VGGRELDHDRAQLPGHDHHDARARHDVLAHAAARRRSSPARSSS